MKKERIDILLVERGLVSTRAKARALIMAGQVFLDRFFSERALKAGQKIVCDAEIFVRQLPPYVSRGGVKLKSAIDASGIDFKGLTVLDVGASTGGFTDCVLKEGAKKVYALDVGSALIDVKLREDPRVEVIEKCNFRYVAPALFRGKVDVVTVDVSFISLTLILPRVYELLDEGGRAIVLVKPQFEVGRGETVKGIVKDEEKRERVRKKIVDFASQLGFFLKGNLVSPLKGDRGNVEYLLVLQKGERG